tara:strand:- start:118 stop:762 length:645 start_codon:yes stop_codon:yes gene_type:complete
MRLQINKDGKESVYTMINSWSDVTLDKWVKLIDKKEKTKTEETIDTISILSDIPKNLIKELGILDVAVILKKIAYLQEQEDSKLKKIIKVNDIEYGFHPNLEEITLGEYADIETYLKNGLENNLPKLMAVLYRPITEKDGKNYSIEAYGMSDLRMRAEKFKKMKATDVNNALVFFWTLGRELLRILPQYLMEQSETLLDKLQMNNLQTSGVGSE